MVVAGTRNTREREIDRYIERERESNHALAYALKSPASASAVGGLPGPGR